MKIHSQLKQAIILIIIFKKLQYFLKKIVIRVPRLPISHLFIVRKKSGFTSPETTLLQDNFPDTTYQNKILPMD